MTGLIFDIKKYAIHDGPGIRTTIFFKGCPLNCQWCHNPESRKQECEIFRVNSGSKGKSVEKKIGRKVSSDFLISEILKDQIFYEESGGGVTFSGGEPLLQHIFLKEILIKCRDADIHTIIDTSGYVPYENIANILDFTDVLYYDLKLIDSEKHLKYTGMPNDLILENLEKLSEFETKIVIRIPMIPGVTDTDENLNKTASYLLKFKNISDISLLTYNKLGEDKRKRFGLDQYLNDLDIQSDEILLEKSKIFSSLGFNVKIGG